MKSEEAKVSASRMILNFMLVFEFKRNTLKIILVADQAEFVRVARTKRGEIVSGGHRTRPSGKSILQRLFSVL